MNRRENRSDIFRFEWSNHKRILQTKESRQWQGVKVSDKQFFKKLYRLEQPPDQGEWGKLVGIEHHRSGGGKERETESD